LKLSTVPEVLHCAINVIKFLNSWKLSGKIFNDVGLWVVHIGCAAFQLYLVNLHQWTSVTS
jgi:hypothetical protein